MNAFQSVNSSLITSSTTQGGLRKMTELEMLDYLKQSETVQLIIDGKYTPKDLDSCIRNMKKRIRELEHIRQMDMAQIVEQRRQIDFLMGA